ncbi:MAG TPA: Ig-like domain-containing protein [Steroidobacteraceae bacterium]|jgi:hypothetical protein|nr:Ig-like domain-containing protein [Steroidobacteraceae bacterium]
MKRSSLGILIGMLCVASAAVATTYVRVEKDGTKTYSDRPIPGGQPIDIQPAQSYSAPPASNVDSRLPREQQLLQQVDNFKYGSCTVTPANDSTFTNPEEVTISVSTTPPLRPLDSVTLTVDGQAVGPPGTSSYSLTPVFRGTHAVVATVKNQAGQVVCTVNSAFHVMRPSLNSPARR